jgi:ParB/RepB/Spo0J family partition protein
MEHVTLTRKRELIWVSPDRIVPNDNNPRAEKAFTPDELVPLRRSMMTDSVLEPVIISPYKGDTYKLIEGERRWTSARLEGIKEIPAVVVNRMDDSEELVVMLNVHSQRRGWETAEELRAIERLIIGNPDKRASELAAELGMNTATFRERCKVFGMGDPVIAAIGRGELDYYAALRTDEVTKTLAQKRPELTARLGGEAEVRNRLLTKAKVRKGITRELENIRQDARDHEAVPDDVLETYIQRPQATLAEACGRARSLAERRAVDDLVNEIRQLNSGLRTVDVDLYEAPNLSDLGRALASLIENAQGLEGRIVDVTITRVAG